ncbi:MAG TPA: hypothetical protein VN883_06430 [Myxococcales bacterium]|nr:hypothetical protein [Myxococcales bacterium]
MTRFNHAPKLLFHKREINKLMGAVEREGGKAVRRRPLARLRGGRMPV